MTYELISEREFNSSPPEPCFWLAVENKSTLRATFTGSDITGSVSAVQFDAVRKMFFFDWTTASVVFRGDTFRITTATDTNVVSAEVITTPTAGVSRIFFRASYMTFPFTAVSVEQWLRFDHAIIVSLSRVGTNTEIASASFRCSLTGTTVMNLSELAMPFVQRVLSYDSSLGLLNQPENDAHIFGRVTISERYNGATQLINQEYFIDFFAGAFQLLSPNSNNALIHAINPNASPLGELLSTFERPIFWRGFPAFLSFLWDRNLSNPSLEGTSIAPIPLDAGGFGEPNVILLDDSFFQNPTECFWLNGEPTPDPPPPPAYPKRWREITFHFVNGNAYREYVVQEKILFVENAMFNGFTPSGATFYINATAYSFSAWVMALPSTVIGDVLKIEITTPATALPYGSDWLFWLRYATADTTVYPFYRQKVINFSDAKVGADFMFFVTDEIELDPNPAVHSPMYVGIRENPPMIDNYVDFPYNLSSASDITALNAALIGKKNYALHFAYVWNGKFPTGSALASGNADGGFSYRYLNPAKEHWYIFGDAGENSNPNGIPEILGQSKGFDGVSTYTTIDGVSQSNFNRGKTVVIHCEFFTTDLANARTICSSRTNVSFANGIDFYTQSGEIVFRYIDRSFNFIAYIAPIKYGWNSITFVSDGSGNDNGAFMVANGVRAVRIAKTGGWNAGTWDATNNPVQNTFTIGSAYNNTPILYFKDKIAKLNVWSDVPLPTDHELRCLQNVHNYNGGIYQGETYDPTSGFWLKADYKTGTPIITSSAAISVSNFGAITFPTFLP